LRISHPSNRRDGEPLRYSCTGGLHAAVNAATWAEFRSPDRNPDRSFASACGACRSSRTLPELRRVSPISCASPLSAPSLELRPLPSTSITRLHQYCEPLRHPRAPGLSVTGVRLIIPDPRLGASRVACAFLVYMPSPLPRRSHWAYYIAHPSRGISLPRKGGRVGLRIVLFEVCSAFTRVTACTLALSP